MRTLVHSGTPSVFRPQNTFPLLQIPPGSRPFRGRKGQWLAKGPGAGGREGVVMSRTSASCDASKISNKSLF